MLSIVIPCKNEEKYIGELLNSLTHQKGISTKSIISKYKNQLNLNVIDGGLPAIGRNNGAKSSKHDYILFLDADKTLILRSLSFIKDNKYHLVASK